MSSGFGNRLRLGKNFGHACPPNFESHYKTIAPMWVTDVDMFLSPTSVKNSTVRKYFVIGYNQVESPNGYPGCPDAPWWWHMRHFFRITGYYDLEAGFQIDASNLILIG